MIPQKREREHTVSGYLPPLFLTGNLPSGLELYKETFLTPEKSTSHQTSYPHTGDFITYVSTDPSFTLYFNDMEQHVGIGNVTLFTSAMAYNRISYTCDLPESVIMRGYIFVLRDRDHTKQILMKLSGALNFAVGTSGTLMHLGGTICSRNRFSRYSFEDSGIHARLSIRDVPEDDYFILKREIENLVKADILSYEDYSFSLPHSGYFTTEMGGMLIPSEPFSPPGPPGPLGPFGPRMDY